MKKKVLRERAELEKLNVQELLEKKLEEIRATRLEEIRAMIAEQPKKRGRKKND